MLERFISLFVPHLDGGFQGIVQHQEKALVHMGLFLPDHFGEGIR